MAGSVIVAIARTPIGKFQGGLSSLRAPQLGALAIAGALDRAGLAPELVDFVLLGQVIPAGSGQAPARQAGAAAGIPLSVPSTTFNRVCLSGLHSLYLADQMIRDGDAEVVVAGGMESMTNTPYLLPSARDGYRLGDGELLDSLIWDGLRCGIDGIHMGEVTERDTAELGTISREAQDEYAARSHERAANAQKDGRLAEEIVPVSIPQRRGDALVIEADEGIRPGTSVESLAGLRPAFAPGGTVTAGNASQISDGAAVMLVTSRAKADELALEPLAELVGYGMVAGPGTGLLHQPSNAIRRVLERSGHTLGELDLFEINEAFASVCLAAIDDLGVGIEDVNVNGGAIALGHPVGASGARIAMALVQELRRRGGGLGTAALCGGGGQGDAAILRVF